MFSSVMKVKNQLIGGLRCSCYNKMANGCCYAPSLASLCVIWVTLSTSKSRDQLRMGKSSNNWASVTNLSLRKFLLIIINKENWIGNKNSYRGMLNRHNNRRRDTMDQDTRQITNHIVMLWFLSLSLNIISPTANCRLLRANQLLLHLILRWAIREATRHTLCSLSLPRSCLLQPVIAVCSKNLEEMQLWLAFLQRRPTLKQTQAICQTSLRRKQQLIKPLQDSVMFWAHLNK